MKKYIKNLILLLIAGLCLFFGGYSIGSKNEKIIYQDKLIFKDKEDDKTVKEIKKDVYSTAVADLREWLHKFYLLKQ